MTIDLNWFVKDKVEKELRRDNKALFISVIIVSLSMLRFFLDNGLEWRMLGIIPILL